MTTIKDRISYALRSYKLPRNLEEKLFDVFLYEFRRKRNDDIVEFFKFVSDVVEKIRKRYGRKIRHKDSNSSSWVFPVRPVKDVYIDCNPPEIEFGVRNFKAYGGVYGFFLANQDIYGYFGRTELSSFDSGLYRSLLRQGIMSEVIPEDNTIVDATKIIESFKNSGSIKETVLDTGYSYPTVRKYLIEGSLV